MTMEGRVVTFAGVVAILIASVFAIIGGAIGFHGLQQWLFAQGAPPWFAVGIPLSGLLTLSAWAYWRTFQIMRRP